MAEKPEKDAAALSAMNPIEEQPVLRIAFPQKPEAIKGKRSAAGWKQKAVLPREASIERADRTDFPISCRRCSTNGLPVLSEQRVKIRRWPRSARPGHSFQARQPIENVFEAGLLSLDHLTNPLRLNHFATTLRN